MPNQNEAQLTGRRGERWFVSRLPPTWIFQPPLEDVGVDGVVVICSSGPLNGLEFRVQIKSSRKWRTSENFIVLKNVKTSSFRYWVTGFTPTLLVLYETSTDQAYFSWANQLLSDKVNLLSASEKEVSLRVPMTSPVDEAAWDRIGHQVLAMNSVLFRRMMMSGTTLLFLRALNALSQAAKGLYVVQHARPRPGERTADQEALMQELEVTCHRDVVRAMRSLADEIDSAGGGVTGFREYAETYKRQCDAIIEGFGNIAASPDRIQECQIAPEGLAYYRNGFMHSLIDTIHQLTEAAVRVGGRTTGSNSDAALRNDV